MNNGQAVLLLIVLPIVGCAPAATTDDVTPTPPATPATVAVSERHNARPIDVLVECDVDLAEPMFFDVGSFDAGDLPANCWIAGKGEVRPEALK